MGKRVMLRFKPLALTVAGERKAICEALKQQFEGLLAMANDTSLPQKLRLRAMHLAVQTAEAMAGILKDASLDAVDAQVKELQATVKGELERRKREQAMQLLRGRE